jgi:ABC-2 type transport system ATP-binding protein
MIRRNSTHWFQSWRLSWSSQIHSVFLDTGVGYTVGAVSCIPMEPIVRVRNLTKRFRVVQKPPGALGAFRSLFRRRYRDIAAVDGVTFEILPGERVGFLGPNGAGKTTTLKMLSGILYPTAGEAAVLGFNPTDRRKEMLRRLALVMGNKMQLWWDLPAWDGFLVLKEVYDVPDTEFRRRVDGLIEALDLSERVNTQVRRLSLGERMKCELVAALLHDPSLVFLDEPTLGLDVISQKRIREFLREYNEQSGATLLLTSHYMQDVAEVCDRVIVIDHGRIAFDGSLGELVRQFSTTKVLKLVLNHPVQEPDLRSYGNVLSCTEYQAILEVERTQITSVAARILAEQPVEDLTVEELGIDEIIRRLFAQGQAGANG